MEEDFSVLEAMSEEAKAYGANSSFAKPSLDADSLSNIVTSLASSLTSSVTEMTDLASGKTKILRDVRREKLDAPDDSALTKDWWMYWGDAGNYVDSIDTWGHYKLNDFVRFIDPRCANCFGPCAPSTRKECIVCGAVHWCSTYCEHEDRSFHAKQCRALKRKVALSKLKVPAAHEIPSWNVAMKSSVFDEGAERVVHKFRFLDNSGTFIGPKMVAKESRFVVEDDNAQKRHEYHRRFLRTQSIAAEFAMKFNQALDGLLTHFPGEQNKRTIMKFPRIEFLEPLVVNVFDADQGNISFLIEPMLDVAKYTKFNNNMGQVHGQPKVSVDELAKCMGALHLGSIQEGDDESEESDDYEEEEFFAEANAAPDDTFARYSFVGADIPQAFSHFTHYKSKGSLMVTDLQGVLAATSDGGSVYKLTDPAVHKRRKRKGAFTKWDFGRTDRGSKGMRLFFASHKCSGYCKLLGLPEGEENFKKKR